MEPVRILTYCSNGKLTDDFSFAPASSLSAKSIEFEASPWSLRVRTSMERGHNPDSSMEQRLEQAITFIEENWSANTNDPASCISLSCLDWLEFSGNFLHGPRLRDSDLIDRNVYTFMSTGHSSCPIQERRADHCPAIELILCGSRHHVKRQHGCSPSRMGSGSDWLHDLAADLIDRERRSDGSLPGQMNTTSQHAMKFAARSAYGMLTERYAGTAHFHGHAEVLCNFEPEPFEHRLIVATPLYVETPRPAPPTTGRRWSLPRLFRR